VRARGWAAGAGSTRAQFPWQVYSRLWLTFNLSVLFSSASTLLRVPLFLLALLVVRGLPAEGPRGTTVRGYAAAA